METSTFYKHLQEAYLNIYEMSQDEDEETTHGMKSSRKRSVEERRERKKKDKEKYHNESSDYYDIVLSHLLDEGYAETTEAAEAIMVSMSEEWIEDIVEARGEGPEKATPGTQLFQDLLRGVKKVRGSKETRMDTAAFQGKGSRAKRRMNNEEVDIYDIIFSHLLDEGYAETSEAAEAIMVSMSENWINSIVESTAIDKL